MRIEGYFGNIKTANETIKKLNQAGYKDTFLDMLDHYDEDRNVQANLPGTETSVSNSGLVLGSGAYGIERDKAPLSAASPMVSGIGKVDEIADVNCRIVVESTEKDSGKARQIIKEMGGDLESPNVEKPRIENIEEINLNNVIHETREFLNQQDKKIWRKYK